MAEGENGKVSRLKATTSLIKEFESPEGGRGMQYQTFLKKGFFKQYTMSSIEDINMALPRRELPTSHSAVRFHSTACSATQCLMPLVGTLVFKLWYLGHL